jgi:hypothetical protein
MRTLMAFLMVLVSPGAVLAQADGGADEAIPVAIVLTRDYPAFQPDTAGDGRRTLRGIVFLGTIGESNTRTILLNPLYADEHALYEALSIIRRHPRAPRGEAGAVALGLQPSVLPPRSQVAERLRTILEALRSPDAPESRWMRTDGKIVEIPDARAFFRDRS